MSDDVTAAEDEKAETVDLTDDNRSDNIPVEDQGILGRVGHAFWWIYLRRGFAYLGLVGALTFFLLSLTSSSPLRKPPPAIGFQPIGLDRSADRST